MTDELDIIQKITEAKYLSDDEIRELIANPNILPCAQDRTIKFWIERLKLWGEPKITYRMGSGRKVKIGWKELETLMSSTQIDRTFSKWDIKETGLTSMRMVREVLGTGKKETVDLKIDLNKFIKKSMRNFKF